MIKLVVFDLDGTLFKNDKTVSEENKEAIEYFKKLQMIRHQLIKEYTDRFDTIYSYNMGDSDNWNWNQGNFPWTSSKKGRC